MLCVSVKKSRSARNEKLHFNPKPIGWPLVAMAGNGRQCDSSSFSEQPAFSGSVEASVVSQGSL